MRISKAILLGGLTAGALDLADALIFSAVRGTAPVRVLQAIASGLLGPEAFQGGLPTAVLGAFLHFVIAFAAAAVYVGASLRLPALRRKPLVWGPLYGIAVFLVMNFVVLPLSAYRTRPMTLSAGLVNLILAHMFLVGLPIAFFAARARAGAAASARV